MADRHAGEAAAPGSPEHIQVGDDDVWLEQKTGLDRKTMWMTEGAQDGTDSNLLTEDYGHRGVGMGVTLLSDPRDDPS
jgi:hypothetical protein